MATMATARCVTISNRQADNFIISGGSDRQADRHILAFQETQIDSRQSRHLNCFKGDRQEEKHIIGNLRVRKNL